MSTVVDARNVSHDRNAPIEPGQMVLTVDNMKLGTVKEATETHFKVDARFQRDYWLSRELVQFSDERVVGLRFRSDETELHKLRRPADRLSDTASNPATPSEDMSRWENGPFPP
jgi:hypothetical protein